MTIALAVLSLLTALVPLVIWYVKRKQSPTPEERRDDLRREYANALDEVAAARRRGDDAGAESLLRRLRAQAAEGGAGVAAGGQRGAGGAPGGDGASTPEQS